MTNTTNEATETVILDIEGMTCSSCVARVEKTLTEIPGVIAAVNLVNNTAKVEYPNSVETDALLQQVAKIGYTAHLPVPREQRTEHEHLSRNEQSLRTRLIVSVILTTPLVLISMVPTLQFMYWQWVALALSTPVVFYCGWPFHRATFLNLRHRTLTMDTLITMGTFAAYGWSLYALFFGMAGMPGMHHSLELFAWQTDPTMNIYLEVAAGVTTFLLIGRYLEERSKRSAGAALRALGEMTATEATLLINGREVTVPASTLMEGDIFLVRPGGIIPTDGRVIEGRAAVDESALTGESVPVDVSVDSQVTGSTVVLDGTLTVVATRVGENTRMAQLATLVEDAQLHKANIQRLADRISSFFVPIVIGLSLLTLLGWVLAGAGLAAGFTAAVAVLVIACPCALGLATPVALMVGTGRAAQLGIIISGPDAIESSRTIDTVLLDKTGTVTTGQMSVQRVVTESGVDAVRALQMIGSVEHLSEHPLARAIVREATKNTDAHLASVSDFSTVAGQGVRGVIDTTELFVGTQAWISTHHLTLSPELNAAMTEMRAGGATAVLAGWSGQVQAVIAVADAVREDSAAAIARLVAAGMQPVLLTGDHEDVARAVAQQVSITEFYASATPESKREMVTRLQSQGKRVAMIGDGVNDAAALATADLGIAMGTGTDVAIAASDITLVRATLDAAVDAIAISRRTLGIIRGNLFWAFAYNVAAIPLAALGFLNPMLAGAAMAFSSLFVVLNSLRLRSFDR